MSIKKKLVVGLSVTGNNEYWALALVTLFSVLSNLDKKPDRVLIVTDQPERFEQFRRLEDKLGIKIERVIPRMFYQELVPEMKGNFATYWKFDLFHALNHDEVLMYLDVDAFVVNPISTAVIIDIFRSSKVSLAAVPSPRPVIERFAATRISNPYNYINAGVLFGTFDKRYEQSSICNAFNEIVNFDTLKLHWHDQDIFNYLFRDDTFYLPYVYNVHTGYLFKSLRSSCEINELASDDIYQNTKIAHISGDFLLSKKFHPYKKKFKDLIDAVESIIDGVFFNFDGDPKGMLRGLSQLRTNAKSTNFDYALQCCKARPRIFADRYYFSDEKIKFRKFKRVIRRFFSNAL